MQEKDMVLDVLSGAKASIGTYAKVITECGNQNLRQTFQQMRDSDEKFQYDLYKVAEQKGYYVPSPACSPQDSSSIKNSLSQASSSMPQGQGGAMPQAQAGGTAPTWH
ncbi:MAG: spore coat protein [Clostridiales bacterium]|jgi:spore coat protein CotF|nr:spore coat protein [Clostridiales bacterium]